MHDAVTAARKPIEVLGVTQPVMETWEHMSEADRRRNIEVTPEMVEAGFDALTSFDSRDYPSRAMVMAVFDAMLAALPRPTLGSSDGLHSSETPDLPLRVASEFPEQSA